MKYENKNESFSSTGPWPDYKPLTTNWAGNYGASCLMTPGGRIDTERTLVYFVPFLRSIFGLDLEQSSQTPSVDMKLWNVCSGPSVSVNREIASINVVCLHNTSPMATPPPLSAACLLTLQLGMSNSLHVQFPWLLGRVAREFLLITNPCQY